MLAKHAEMEQHVALDLVADEEAEAARRVEPFHPAGDRRGSSGADRRSSGRRSGRSSLRRASRSALLHAAPGHLTWVSSVGKPTLICDYPAILGQLRRGRFRLPGGRSTIARARSKPWPARIIAASACSRALRSAASLANGPIRRRSAKRSAAATAPSLAACLAPARRRPRRPRPGAAPGRPAARHSRARSASAPWTARRRRRRHSRARRSARPAPRCPAARGPSQPRSRILRRR